MNMILTSNMGPSLAPITTPDDIERLRRRCAHYLTPEIAAVANLSLHQFTQFVAGSFTPDAEQLNQLARRVGR